MLNRIIYRRRHIYESAPSHRRREERSDDAIHSMLHRIVCFVPLTVFAVIITTSLCMPTKSLALTDPIEYANYMQNMKTALNSVMQLHTQSQMLSSQMSYFQNNSQHLDADHYQNIINEIQQLDNMTNQGQSISYSMQNVDQQFRKSYPNYTQQPYNNPSYQTAYQNWNNTSMNTFSNSLQSIGANASQMQEEGQLMNQLESQSHNATGSMQEMQVANEMSAENVRQVESLKHMVAAQNNAQTAYMAHQISKTSYEQNSMNQVSSNMDTSFPAYKNNANFGEIKSGN